MEVFKNHCLSNCLNLGNPILAKKMSFAHSQWNKFKKIIFTYIYSLKLKRKTLVFFWIPFLPHGFINSFTSERSEKELPAVYLMKRTQNQAYPLGICLQPLFPSLPKALLRLHFLVLVTTAAHSIYLNMLSYSFPIPQFGDKNMC